MNATGTHGFVKNGPTVTPIDVPGAGSTGFAGFGFVFGLGINNAGDIAGSFTDASGGGHGFLKIGNIFTTVDVPGASQTIVLGINNADDLVGAFNQFQLGPGATTPGSGAHGFLATPIETPPGAVPEPASLLLLSSGVLPMLLRHRHSASTDAV